jgi:hypothetical protein
MLTVLGSDFFKGETQVPKKRNFIYALNVSISNKYLILIVGRKRVFSRFTHKNISLRFCWYCLPSTGDYFLSPLFSPCRLYNAYYCHASTVLISIKYGIHTILLEVIAPSTTRGVGGVPVDW